MQVVTCPRVPGDDAHVQGGAHMKQVLGNMHFCTCKNRSTAVCGLSREAVE